MRGYYALYDDMVYKLDGRKFQASEVVGARETHIDINSNSTDTVDISLLLSNFDVSAPSNKEFFENVSDVIKSKKLTELTELTNSYRMYVYYTITNNLDNTVVDTGILVNDFEPRAVLYPLGLDDENEYVTRLAMSSGNIFFSRDYRETASLGIQKSIKRSYTLKIDRITVIQFAKSAFDETRTVIEATRHNRHDIAPINMHPYHTFPHYHRPSMNYSVSGPDMKKDNYVTVYDSSDNGIDFDYITINNKFRHLSIRVCLNLNNYLVTVDSSDIDTLLEENIEVRDPDESISNGDDLTGDVVHGNTDIDEPPVKVDPSEKTEEKEDPNTEDHGTEDLESGEDLKDDGNKDGDETEDTSLDTSTQDELSKETI